MKRFALIGRDIAHSGSPALFKAAYGGKYAYDLLDGDNFDVLFERFHKDYSAVNITSPFKEDALKKADEVSDAAALCGAANMLIKMPDGKILADNSDFEGVTLSLMSAIAIADDSVDVDDEDSFADYLADRSALIVGCSGAGKAAAAATVTLGYGRTVLMNRTVSKAEALRDHLAEYYEDLSDEELTVAPLDRFEEEFAKADLVIYTVPCPVKGSEGLEPDKGKMVLEANYKDPCLDYLSGRCNYVSGFNWLFNQAAVSFEAFTGEAPDEEQMQKVEL